MRGYVYILTNEHMPGLVKIGRTTDDPHVRARQLFQTGVPSPFSVWTSFLSPDCAQLETLAHEVLKEKRVNESREFFAISGRDAAEIIEVVHREMIDEWVDEYAPGMVVIDGDMHVCCGKLAEIASELNAHPAEIANAIGHILADEVRPALMRYKEWVSRRVFEAGSEQ